MKEGLKIKDQIEKQKPGLSLSFDNSDKNIPLGSPKTPKPLLNEILITLNAPNFCENGLERLGKRVDLV